jgi:intein/homing endonuclease
LTTQELVGRLLSATEMLCGEVVTREDGSEDIEPVRFYSYQRVFVARVIESILLNDGATITALWARQCVAEGTVVLSRDGTACRIEDHPDAWSTGHREVFRVKAGNGYTVRVTGDHRMLTKRGWVPAEDLREGDMLCALNGWDEFGDGEVEFRSTYSVGNYRVESYDLSVTITPDAAKILGYLTADGYSFRALEKGQSVKFVNIREEYLSEFERLVAENFEDVKTTRYAKGKGFDVVCTSKERSCRPNSLRQFLAAMDPDEGFPRAVFRASEESILSFLNRLYAADGCAWSAKGGRNQALDLACGGSETYARYVQVLLARIGVHGTIRTESMNDRPFHRVQVADKRGIRRFLEAVGPIYGKEKACARLATTFDERWSNRKTEEAPEGEDGERRQWVRFKSREPDGSADVYDMEVPGKGWFFANGIAVHNCGKSTGVAHLAMGLMVWLPVLARLFPDDDRLSPFLKGLWIGIFAPVDDQAKETFSKIRDIANSEAALRITSDPEVGVVKNVDRGDMVSYTNGSKVRCRSASEDSQIEGKTYHLVLLEEAQKISRNQVDKAIKPMLTSTNGSMVKIGTAWESRGGFHTSIQFNVESHRRGGPRNHFEFPYDDVIRAKRAMYDEEQRAYDAETLLLQSGKIKIRTRPRPAARHLNYEKWVKEEVRRLGGTDTLEFKMNFRCLWMEARIIAVDPAVLAAAAMTDMEATNGPVGFGFQVAGLDLGKSNDRTVLTVGMVDYANPYVNLVVGQDAEAEKQVFYPKYIQDWLMLEGPFEGTNGQYEMLVEYLRFTHVKVLAMDATTLGGGVIFERLEWMIGGSISLIPFTYNINTKSEGFKYYLQELKTRRLFYPAGPQTQQTFVYRQFVKEHLDLDRVVSGNHTLIQAPADDPEAHDDFPNSAMLMCWAEKMAADVIMPEAESVSSTTWKSSRSGGGGTHRYARR